MPIDKKALLDRLEAMFWLPNADMVRYIEIDVEIRAFVGIEPEGSVFFDITRPGDDANSIELTILPDGSIEYVELRGTQVVCEAGFHLSYETINDILK